MPFRFVRLAIPEVRLIEPRVYRDHRGSFMESYKRSEFAREGITEHLLQISHSRSRRDVLRGLHYQKQPKSQGKLIRVISGAIYDVAVDLRRGECTYGRWVAETLTSEEKKMLYIPQGFAHGFCVLSDEADVLYATTSEYDPDLESGIIWNDPDLRIEWPINQPVLSERDSRWPYLRNADNNF